MQQQHVGVVFLFPFKKFMTKIATWNVNSINARLPLLSRWLDDFRPDILLLQELKCIAEKFPRQELEDKGYNIAINGQKTYNGVAILSKSPIDIELTELPGNPNDEQARYLEVFTKDLLVASIYAPNGNPVDSEKFPYKLEFMERLYERIKLLLQQDTNFILGGDFNVIPEPDDCYDPSAWNEDALFRPETRAAWRKLIYLGLSDGFRILNKEAGQYSFWDYQRGAWNKNNGIRIDHFLLSPILADNLEEVGIDSTPRGWERPSDHTPVWCKLIGS